MYYIIYMSAGTGWFNETELRNILDVSRVNNERNNITGLLLYSDGNFIQLLEGEQPVVQETFEKINLDPRHKSVTPIASGELKARNFPKWAMGFKSVHSSQLTQLDGYLNPADKNFLGNKEQHIAVNLLKAFVRKARAVF